MVVGIDFDNTLVCYDDLFHRAAVARGLLATGESLSKQAVRDELRRTGRELQWTELQGYVYGDLIREAPPFPGVRAFFAAARQRGVALCIVSHKTVRPYAGSNYDLRQAALAWLQAQGLVSDGGAMHDGLPQGSVYFEETLAGKLQRIGQLGCTHFIDDLPELLAEPSFPPGVQKILFAAPGVGASASGCNFAGDWPQIATHLFSGRAP